MWVYYFFNFLLNAVYGFVWATHSINLWYKLNKTVVVFSFLLSSYSSTSVSVSWGREFTVDVILNDFNTTHIPLIRIWVFTYKFWSMLFRNNPFLRAERMGGTKFKLACDRGVFWNHALCNLLAPPGRSDYLLFPSWNLLKALLIFTLTSNTCSWWL